MDVSWTSLFTLVAFVACYIWFKSQQNLPPGPWNLPLLGYLLWLDPQHPYLTLTALSQKYGPIYGLHLGSVYTVVISDARIIKKIFNKDSVSGRAPLHLTHGIMQGYGLICAEGALWKDQRKFVHSTLRALGASRINKNNTKMEDIIMRNVLDFVQDIKNKGSQTTLDPLDSLRHSLGSSINQMVFGKSWLRNDKTWTWLQYLQEEGTKYIGVAGPLNFLWFLRFLPKYKKIIHFLIDGKEKTHEIYKTIIQEQNLEEGEVKNFIQAFMMERIKQKDTDKENFYCDQQFHHLLADIFGASLDTTLTTLRWYFLYIAVHQDVQAKIRKDLDEIVGNREPTLEDIAFLPYVEASIAEVQRIRSVVPVGIPHGTLEETEVEGFKIPKGAMIIPLQWAVHMDPKLWDNPHCFKPERFIDEEGKFFKPESFIPFQTGKRMCVGDELARMFLFLYAATLIKNFHIVCEDKEKIDFTGDCGITLTPKPYKLTFSVL